jgi:hypothetical protein
VCLVVVWHPVCWMVGGAAGIFLDYGISPPQGLGLLLTNLVSTLPS